MLSRPSTPAMAKEAQQACLHISALPDISKAKMDFPNTSFFQGTGPSLPELPCPSTILALDPRNQIGVVKMEELNLAVKVGPV